MLDSTANGTPPLFDHDQLAEFFAVATEEFFDRPRALQKHAPNLFHFLSTDYHQDPATTFTHPPLNMTVLLNMTDTVSVF